MNDFKPGDKVRLKRCSKPQCYACDEHADKEGVFVENEPWTQVRIDDGRPTYWPNDALELLNRPDTTPLPLPG